MGNAGLDESQARIKISRRNTNNLSYADDSTLMAENKEGLKSLLMKVKEESEKAGLKLTIQKIKIKASNLITSWQKDGVNVETVAEFISWTPKSLWIVTKATKPKKKKKKKKKPHTHLLLGRKAMTNIDSILKSRYYSADKDPYSQIYGFSSNQVWM